jgi:hypothetical protein
MIEAGYLANLAGREEELKDTEGKEKYLINREIRPRDINAPSVDSGPLAVENRGNRGRSVVHDDLVGFGYCKPTALSRAKGQRDSKCLFQERNYKFW